MSNDQQGNPQNDDRHIAIGTSVTESTVVSGDGNTVTVTNTKIIQISADEIKTRELNLTSPYKGLKKFEPEDTNRFFGRDQFLSGLVNELEQTNLILLLGASGSGKSSVVRAGLIPWLQQKWGNRFVSLMFTPDRDPFESFYGSLLSRGYSQSQAQMAKAGKSDTLSQVVKTLKPPESFWLIFIDQFEELFTVSEDKKRDRFIEGLVKLSQERASDRLIKIVVTMRSDFLDRLDPAPANLLARATQGHRPLITQMQPEDLRQAIEQPAAHHGVVFETELVEEIIQEVRGQAGCLPLLQYTLDLLWETEVQNGGIQDRTLNISSYRNLGGVRGGLQQRVEQIYQTLSPLEQLATQQIFLKLVEIGGDEASGTEWKPLRRRANRTEFKDEQEQAVLTQLINQNLLVSDAVVQAAGAAPESTVEIAHEILLTSWSTLHTWIQENRKAIALRNRLNDDVALWQVKKADSDLWSGSKLAQVVELQRDPVFQQVLGGFSDGTNQFIDASVGLRDRQRRRAVIGLSGFSVVALALSGFAFYQLQQAQRQRVEQLAATAQALLTTQPVEAEVNAIAAAGLSQSTFVQVPNHPRFASTEGGLLDVIRANSERSRLIHDAEVSSVAFSPDGRMIVSGSWDETMRLWDAQSGKRIELIDISSVNLTTSAYRVSSVAFSPDGRMIVSGSWDMQGGLLWNVQSGELLGLLANHGGAVSSVAISSDGKMIVSGSADKTVLRWDAQSWNGGNQGGELIRHPLIHDAEVSSVAISPDGKMIASGSADKTVRLWDAQSGKAIGHPLIHDAEVSSVAISPDGKTIASGSADKTVRLWDAQSGKQIGAPLQGHTSGVSSIAISPDGKTIVSGSQDKTVRLWDVRTGEPIGQPLIGHTAEVWAVTFSPDGKTIVSGSADKTVRLWDAKSGKQIGHPLIHRQPLAHSGIVTSVAFSLDGKTIASSSKDKTVRLWDAKSGKAIGHPLIHDAEVIYVAISPDGKTIVSGSKDKTVRLWDAKTGKQIGHPLIHDAEVICVAISPGGKTIVSGSKDTTVRLWDAQSGKQIGHPLYHYTEVYAVAISSDGKMIVSGSADKTVRLWDAKSGKQIGHPLIHDAEVYAVAISPDGKTIVSGSADKTVRLWDAKSGKQIGHPLIHDAEVWAVAISPDGKMIVSGSADKTVRLWDAKTGEPIGQPLIGHTAEVYAVAFSPDSKTIASGSADNTVQLWDASPGSWLHIACQQLQYHSILTDPRTDVAREAQQTCEPIWKAANRQHSPAASLPPSPSASLNVPPSPTPTSFNQAVNQATEAAQLTQTAKTAEQWNTVATHWQQAITLMQAVPTTDPHYATAQQKIGEYQKNLQYAQKAKERY